MYSQGLGGKVSPPDAEHEHLPRVDHECSAHGDCVEIAPQVFRLDDSAVVIGTDPEEFILETAEACPAVAISVIDSETGETADVPRAERLPRRSA